MYSNFLRKQAILTVLVQICPKRNLRQKKQFWGKTNNFEFLGPNLSKNGFWSRNFKNLSLDSESASLRYYVYQFWNKTDYFEFLGPNLPKNGFLDRNFKNLSQDSNSTPPIYHVCQFSVEMDNVWFLGKLPNYL